MEVTHIARFGTAGWYRRMGGAKRYPSPMRAGTMGIASPHPSYGLLMSASATTDERTRWVSLRSTHPTANAPCMAYLCERRK